MQARLGSPTQQARCGPPNSAGLSSKRHMPTQRSQLPSFVLFFGLVVLLNLCSFQQDFVTHELATEQRVATTSDNNNNSSSSSSSNNNNNNRWLGLADSSALHSRMAQLSPVESCLTLLRLIFSNPMRLRKRTITFTQVEARVLGKMAKVWYIKKKIKKLSKKLKKHTIAVPVFTAIPIYEHSYYPQPHVTHVTHGAMHHHAAAASSYVPTLAQYTPVTASSHSSAAVAAAAPNSNGQQQLATSASNQHQVASYRMAPGNHASMYHHASNHHHHHHPSASAHQIINAYPPSPPLYVDEAGGLYGHYGNAYGRYDGGYQYW